MDGVRTLLAAGALSSAMDALSDFRLRWGGMVCCPENREEMWAKKARTVD